MWFVTRYDGHPMPEIDALKQSSLANKVTNIVRRDSFFVAIVKSVINYSAVFEKEHGVSFVAARKLDIAEYMVLSDSLSGNRPKTYPRDIWVAKFYLQRSDLLNTIGDTDGA